MAARSPLRGLVDDIKRALQSARRQYRQAAPLRAQIKPAAKIVQQQVGEFARQATFPRVRQFGRKIQTFKIPEQIKRAPGPTQFGISPVTGAASPLMGLAESIIRSYGKTTEELSTPAGRRILGKSAKRIIKKPLQLKTLEEPAFEAALNISDLLPGGIIFGGVKRVGKRTVPKVIKAAARSDELLDMARVAISQGDESAAKAILKQVKGKKPKFSQLVEEVTKVAERQIKKAKGVAKAKFGDYQTLAQKMRSFLAISGERKPVGGRELFREHIPRRIFGVSSDEIASALGKSETEFMAELTKDLNIVSSGRAKPKDIARFRSKVQKLTKNTDKLDPEFFKVVKEWDDTVRAVTAKPTKITQKRILTRSQKAAEKTAKQDFIAWQKSVFKETGATRTSKQLLNDGISQVQINTASPLARNIDNLKDIGEFRSRYDQVYRIFSDVYGPRIAEAKRILLDPFDAAKGRYVDEQTRWLTALKRDIIDTLGIKKGSKLSELVQRYGEGPQVEGGIDLVELKRLAPTEWEKVVQADQWFRAQYDRLLTEVNAVRAKVYPNNPEKLIPKRKDYYRHFQELAEGYQGAINILLMPSQISPELARISYWTRPKSKWLSFAQKRIGRKSELDAVGGFIDYIRAASYAKEIDPHIGRFRALARELESAAVEKGIPKLNNFTLYLDRFANDLAGKTGPLDRAIQEAMPGGRTTFRMIDWANRRYKANLVLGNLSASLSQIYNIPLGIADTGLKNSAVGFVDTLVDIFRPGTAMDASDFLKERYSFKIYNQFNEGMVQDTRKLFQWLLNVGDEVGTKITWNSQYRKAVEQGIENAVKFADDATRNIVAGRGVGELPLAQKERMFQLIAPFQIEVGNQWWVMKDWIDEKAYGRLLGFFVANHLFNNAVEQVTGRRVGFDPIDALKDGLMAYQEDDEKPRGAAKIATRQIGEVLSNLPFVQSLIGGLPIPKEVKQEYFGEQDPTRFGGGIPLLRPLESLARGKIGPVAAGFGLPYGGAQLKKTLTGAGAVIRGGPVTEKGELRFPLDNTLSDRLKAIAFGPYANEEARFYFDNELRQLTRAETQSWEKIVRRGNDPVKVWAMIQKAKVTRGLQPKISNVLKDDRFSRAEKARQIEEIRREHDLLIDRLNRFGELDVIQVLEQALPAPTLPEGTTIKKTKRKGRKPTLKTPKLKTPKLFTGKRSVAAAKPVKIDIPTIEELLKDEPELDIVSLA